MTDKNTPAFPKVIERPNGSFENCDGMTLRDYFAAHALAGDFAAQGDIFGEITNDTPDNWMMKRAETLYRMADAMIEARKATK